MKPDFRSRRMGVVCAGVIVLGLLGTAALAGAQGSPHKTEAQPRRPAQSGGLARELARESREAAGEDGDAQFKRSPAVRLLAKITGLDLRDAYWLAVGLNFVVVAGVLSWAGRKYLPGLFRDRTTAIQRAIEEARQASAEAERRLAEVEARLAKLGDEIAAMKGVSEQDMAAEEARIRAAAEEDARRIIQTAEQEIRAAAKAARRDLTAYAADLAVSLAKRQIHVDSGTDRVLVRSFAERLSPAGKSKN